MLLAVAALLVASIVAIQIHHLQQHMGELSKQIELKSSENYFVYDNVGYQPSTAYWTHRVFN